MLKNTFIKVNNHSHGNRIVEAFLKLGAKNSRDLIKGYVGQYVGVITDTLTCIPAKDLLTLKGTITITNLEELESRYKNAYKPNKTNLSEYREGFADGFKIGLTRNDANPMLAEVKAGIHKQFIFNSEKERVECRCGHFAVWWKTGYLCGTITAYPCKFN